MTARRRGYRLLAPLLLALFVPLCVGVTPAGAAGPPVASISLAAQSAWTRQGQDALLRLAVHGSPGPNLEVVLHVYSAVNSRLAFEQTVAGERLGGTLATRSVPLASLPLVGSERVLAVGVQDPDLPRDPNRLVLRVPGPAAVFPLQVELQDPDSGTVLNRFVTHLLVEPADGTTAAERLRVAWLWHLAAPPALGADGTVSPAFTRDVSGQGRLGRIADALSTASQVAVTLVPNPETVASMAAMPSASATVQELRDAAPAASVLSGPYTTVNGPSLARGRLDDLIGSQLDTGRSVLEQELGTAVDRTVAPPQRLDAAWLTRLRDDAGVSRVVVDPKQLDEAAPADQFTSARPFRLDTASGSFDAVEVNTTTSDLLVARGSDALRAQQILAALTVIALEQPNRARGVVIDTPVRWDIRPERVEALVAGLRDGPVLRTVDVASLFGVPPATTSSGRPYVRTLAPVPTPAPVVRRGEYRDANREVDALASMTRAEDPVVTRLRHQVQLTPASGLPGTGRGVTLRRLASVRSTVDGVIGGIEAPRSRTFRLTSRRATVPVSIVNRNDRPVSVTVRLESTKLQFPNGAQQTVRVPPGNRNKTLQFDVVARASGTFPVLVDLSSPDGGIDLQRSRYTVRSSAVSGVGAFLTLGAAAFLAVWWFLHWRRSRRPPTGALAT